jgi:hypothetical protein
MTGGVIDPGDPLEPGTLRFEARKRLLECLETLFEEVQQTSDDARRPRDYPAWDDLVDALQRWRLYGRDGE